MYCLNHWLQKLSRTVIREYGVGRGDTSYIFMLCSCRLNKCSISYWQSIMNFNTIKQQIEIKIMKNRWLYSLLLISIIYLVLFYFNFIAYIGDYFEEEKYGFCIHCNGSVMCGTCKCARTLLHWIVKWWRLSLLHTLCCNFRCEFPFKFALDFDIHFLNATFWFQILRLSSAMGKTQNRSPSVRLSLHGSNSNQSSDYIAIFTACKRSLGQGNVFTPVCHSVHLFMGWGLASQHASHATGRHPLSRHPFWRQTLP